MNVIEVLFFYLGYNTQQGYYRRFMSKQFSNRAVDEGWGGKTEKKIKKKKAQICRNKSSKRHFFTEKAPPGNEERNQEK